VARCARGGQEAPASAASASRAGARAVTLLLGQDIYDLVVGGGLEVFHDEGRLASLSTLAHCVLDQGDIVEGGVAGALAAGGLGALGVGAGGSRAPAQTLLEGLAGGADVWGLHAVAVAGAAVAEGSGSGSGSGGGSGSEPPPGLHPLLPESAVCLPMHLAGVLRTLHARLGEESFAGKVRLNARLLARLARVQ
jgi:hypothetical protein